MKTVSMSGLLREDVGKKDAKKLRKEGKVPCVLYGGKDQISFCVEVDSFKDLIFTPEVYLVNLNISGKEYQASLQDVQYHPVTDSILHVDFLEVHEENEITISVPVRTFGVSPGVLKGGKLVQKFRKLKVRGLPKYLPDFIKVDISSLDMLQSAKVQDIKIDNLTLLDDPAGVIVTVKSTRAAAEDEAAGAAPPPAK